MRKTCERSGHDQRVAICPASSGTWVYKNVFLKAIGRCRVLLKRSGSGMGQCSIAFQQDISYAGRVGILPQRAKEKEPSDVDKSREDRSGAG